MYNNSTLSPLRLQTPLASIDKVSLFTPSFQVQNRSNLTVQPHSFSLSEGLKDHFPLFTDTSGEPVHGKKAFANTEQMNVTIERRAGSEFLTVSFNPNKLSHYYEPTTDTTQMRAQICLVEAELSKLGVLVDYEAMRLFRLDLMKQRQFTQSLSTHHGVLMSLSAKRQASRAYLDTFLIGNKQHQTTFYDKAVEAKIPNVSNLIRCEVRALRSNSVNRIFSVNTLKDLFSTDLEALTDRYNTHLRESIFQHRREPNEALSSEIKKLEYYLQQSPRAGVNLYLRSVGIEQVVNRFGSIEAFTDTLVNLDLSRQKAHEWKRKLAVSHSEAIQFSNRAKSETARLFDNLYSFAV